MRGQYEVRVKGKVRFVIEADTDQMAAPIIAFVPEQGLGDKRSYLKIPLQVHDFHGFPGSLDERCRHLAQWIIDYVNEDADETGKLVEDDEEFEVVEVAKQPAVVPDEKDEEDPGEDR